MRVQIQSTKLRCNVQDYYNRYTKVKAKKNCWQRVPRFCENSLHSSARLPSIGLIKFHSRRQIFSSGSHQSLQVIGAKLHRARRLIAAKIKYSPLNVCAPAASPAAPSSDELEAHRHKVLLLHRASARERERCGREFACGRGWYSERRIGYLWVRDMTRARFVL